MADLQTKKLSEGTGGMALWLRPLAATLALQTTSSYLYNVIPTLAPAIMAATQSGESLVGWLSSLNTIGSIAFMLMGTPIIRRYGAIRSLQAGIIVGGLGVLLIGAPVLWIVVLGAMMTGLGYGPSAPAGSDVLQRYAPAKYRMLIFSVRQAGVPLAGVIAGLMLPYVYTHGGWTWVILASLGLVTAVFAGVQPLRRQVDAGRAQAEMLSVRQLLSANNLLLPIRAVYAAPRLPRIAWAGACLAVGHGCWNAFFVTYATHVLGFSLVDAGFAFAIMQAFGIIGRLTLGYVSDVVGSGLVVLKGVAFASAAASFAFAALGSGLSYGGLCVMAAIAGVAVSSWNGIQVAVVAGLVPRESITASTSGATILVFSGFVLGPAVFALLLWVTGEFTAGYVATGVACAMAAPLLMGVEGRARAAG